MQFTWKPSAGHMKIIFGAFSLQLEVRICENFWFWAFNGSTNIPWCPGEEINETRKPRNSLVLLISDSDLCLNVRKILLAKTMFLSRGAGRDNKPRSFKTLPLFPYIVYEPSFAKKCMKHLSDQMELL